MTMKTRSSANYSNFITETSTVLKNTNRTAIDDLTSSSKCNTTTAGAAVNVDTILAAKNEANQKFLRSYKSHLQKQFVVRELESEYILL